MKLSVIICVYNTPKEYLSACLDSITKSTVKDIDGGYEICMVDDGSSVDYSDLIEKHGIRVTKTENKGILSARTTGAKMASGEYAVYCDSDDTVSFNYYLPMVEKAEETGADIVINDWATHTQRARYYAKKDDTIRFDIDVSGDENLLEYLRNEGRQHAYFVLWNKIYKTELLRGSIDNIIRAGIDERCSYSEDAAINFFAWRDAKRVVNIHTGFYFYRIHPTQSVNVASKEKLCSQIDSMAKTLDIMRGGIRENVNKDALLLHIDRWAQLMARYHYSVARGAKYTELYPYIREKYGVEKLKLSTTKDSSSYETKVLIGDNFNDVDNALLSLWNGEKEYFSKTKHPDKYTENSLEYMRKKNKIRENPSSTTSIPKFRNSFKKKVFYNRIINKTAGFFFKKGSKSREFLKKFM